MTLSDQIKAAINDSGLSIRQLAEATGVAQPIISRFVSTDADQSRDIRLATADKLAEYFGLELAPSKARLPSSTAKAAGKSKPARGSKSAAASSSASSSSSTSSARPKKKRRGLVQRLSPEEMEVEIKKVERRRAGRELRIARPD
jgi:hypothetical protein